MEVANHILAQSFPFNAGNGQPGLTEDSPTSDEIQPGVPSFDWPLPLDKLYYWEQNAPNRICFFQPASKKRLQTFTWAEVSDQARRIAQYLLSLGLAPGSHIGIMSPNSAYWIIADLAIWMAGHVSVPIFPSVNQTCLANLIEHSGCELLFLGHVEQYTNIFASLPGTLNVVNMPFVDTSRSNKSSQDQDWADILKSYEPYPASPRRRKDEVATIIYTSGTLGQPKGVMHSFEAMAGTVMRAIVLFSVQRTDRLISFMSLAHVTERLCIELSMLYAGVTVYFVHSNRSLISEMKRCQPTIFFAVPQIWRRFQQEIVKQFPLRILPFLLGVPVISIWVKKRIKTILGLNQARLFSSGAAHISSSLIDWYKKVDIEILEFYGMTENFAYSHTARIGRSFTGYVGYANPGVVAKFSDDGEILVWSPGNMLGYFKDPELTKQAITSEGFIRTGDQGMLDQKGRLKITGRSKESFKTARGKYVYPALIESLFMESPLIEYACVLGAGIQQPLILLRLVDSLLVFDSWQEKKKQIESYLIRFKQRVNAQLSVHEQVSQIVVINEPWTIEDGTLTPTYKIQRSKIEVRFRRKISVWADSPDQIIWYFTS